MNRCPNRAARARRRRASTAAWCGGLSDANGQFVIDLPGRTLHDRRDEAGRSEPVRREAVRSAWHARESGRGPARRLDCAEMQRGAVTGVVRDENGQPAPGVRAVSAVSTINGERTVGVTGGSGDVADTTDDRGGRIFGLGPGEYVISAAARRRTRRHSAGDRSGLARHNRRCSGRPQAQRLPQLSASTVTANVPEYQRGAPRTVDGPTVGFTTILSGTPNPADAQLVAGRRRGARNGPSLRLIIRRASRGHLHTAGRRTVRESAAHARDPGSAQIRLGSISISISPNADGKFAVASPRAYTISARARPAPGPGGPGGPGGGGRGADRRAGGGPP